jgi:predicted pyridoxine 5'-phosphate oxidase superfamily flavin-nucleotide-binding protein
MSSMFQEGSRELQDRFDTRRLADRIEDVLVHDWITPDDAAFIQGRDLFFLATADEQGRPNCTYKGGERGFVRVVGERTLAFPHYNGNGMYISAGNVLRNPHVGLLFIDFEHGSRMRVNGEASVAEDDELLIHYPEAQFVVRVTVREVFPNCPRYIHRFRRVEESPFVPRADCVTPVPSWKRSEWARDVLAADDPAHDPTIPVL